VSGGSSQRPNASARLKHWRSGWQEVLLQRCLSAFKNYIRRPHLPGKKHSSAPARLPAHHACRRRRYVRWRCRVGGTWGGGGWEGSANERKQSDSMQGGG
jgi:hypothetical protein